MFNKSDVDSEIKKYINEKYINDCSLSLCDINNIKQKLSSIFKKCNNLEGDKVYFLYILYFKNTKEIIWLDIDFSKRDNFEKNLEKIILKYKNKIEANFCIDLYILKENNINKIKDNKLETLFNIVEDFKGKLKSFKKKRKNKIKKLYKIPFIDEFSKLLKKFIFQPSIIIAIIILLFMSYYYTLLAKVGIPLDVLNENILSKSIENITIGLFILIFYYLIFIFPILIVIYLAAIFIVTLILIILFYIKKKKLGIFSIKRELLLFVPNFFKIIAFIMILSSIIIIISEPLSFILKDTGIPKILNPFENSSINKIIKKRLLLKTKLFNSNLNFKILNNKPVFILGNKDDLLYYYELEDLIKLNKRIFLPILKNRRKIKKDYCDILNNKNLSKRIRLFYAIFIIPSLYDIYPLEYSQGDIRKILVISNNKTKIDNLNESNITIYLDILEKICKNNNDKNNSYKTKYKSK